MRMMLKAHLDVEAANLAIGDGSIADVFAKVFGLAKPEATYFLVEAGRRTVYAVFEMPSPDMIPVVAEPLFQAFGAEVSILPVMTQPDLEAGLRNAAAARG
jgi:hypothetical protein